MATVAGPETPAQVAEAILAAFLTHDSDRILAASADPSKEIGNSAARPPSSVYDGPNSSRGCRRTISAAPRLRAATWSLERPRMNTEYAGVV